MNQTNKTKRMNKQSKPLLTMSRKKQILIVVGVLALIFIAWMLVRKNIILPRQEKARFGFAEQQ
jgi:hypothetical protein